MLDVCGLGGFDGSGGEVVLAGGDLDPDVDRGDLTLAVAEFGFLGVAETSDLNVMVQLVAEGIGVALIPRSGLEEAKDVVTIAVTHPTIDRRIILTWRPGAASPAARAFITLAQEHLGQRAART